MRTRTFFRYALLAFASAAAACGVHQQQTPSLTGPSEFALSVSVTALPDSINQDGGSQSSIRVVAHDASGQPKNGQPFRLDILVNGSEVDFGTLSARTIVTGSDGTAFAVYTAPPAAPSGSTVATCSTFNTPGALAGQCVSIAATPTGSNFSTSQTQTVEIRLMPPGIIIPPASSPTAQFTVTPTPVSLNVPANFDASASCGGAVAAGTCDNTNPITSYAWTFGDGSSGSGKVTPHTYASTGTFSVTLTVTNSRGLSSSTSQSVSTGVSIAPTADFSFSPASPNVGDFVLFDANLTKPAAGHVIVQYSWDFGDPASGDQNSAAGLSPQHKFNGAGIYVVVLTVRDDADQKSSTTKAVNVGTGNPVAVITSSPSAPVHGTVVSFSSAGSTTSGGATITTYVWDFGDASPAPGNVSSTSHTYVAAGAYTVRLTITDSQGRVGTATVTVTVS